MNDLGKICREHNLTIDRKLSGGYICSSVFLCTRPKGERVVVKYGSSEMEKEEIALNIAGYQNMRDALGLGFFTPIVYDCSSNNSSSYVLLEYCGPDFQSLLESGGCSATLTNQLLETMRGVFKRSRSRGHDGGKSIQDLVDRIAAIVREYVIPHFDLNVEDRKRLDTLPMQFRDASEEYSFATWDFTPNNLCKLGDVVKFIDPRSKKVTGNPIPGLACYAGIIRDVHRFRNAETAYKTIYRFATVEVSEMLHIEQALAERQFLLGRLFQSLMGVCVRVEKSRSEAEPFFRSAMSYLAHIV